MEKIKTTEKKFGEALRELLDERYLTYEIFAEKSKVSKTYLSMILVHYRVPSREIIKRISKALEIDPNYFKEFRLLEIISKLEKYVTVTDLKDIEKLEKIIENIKARIPRNFKVTKPKKREDRKLDLKYLVNLSNLNEKEFQTIMKVIEGFMEKKALADALERYASKNKK